MSSRFFGFLRFFGVLSQVVCLFFLCVFVAEPGLSEPPMKPLQAQPKLQPSTKVFIVNSYNPTDPCGQPQQLGVISALREAGYIAGKNLQLEIFYMDTKGRYTSEAAVQERGREALRRIEAFKPDAVVTLDDNAFRTVALQLVDRPIPVVFSGMNGQPEDYDQLVDWMITRKNPGHNITGVYEHLHIADALRIHKIIFPNTKKVLFITDTSYLGKALKKQILLEMQNYDRATCDWDIREAESWESYQEIIKGLQEDPHIDAIYPVAVQLIDKSGRVYTTPEIISWTRRHNQKPELGLNHEFVRLGLFGGAAVDFYSMGMQAGQMLLRILKGEKPGTIPIEDAKRYVLVFNIPRARELNVKIPEDILLAADALYTEEETGR